MKNSFVQSKINAITRTTTVEIPNLVNSSSDKTIADYDYLRYGLNRLIIEALTGGEIVDKEDGSLGIKFNHKLPSMAEVYEVSGIVEDFVYNVENPFINSFATCSVDADGNPLNDMEIPPAIVVTSSSIADVKKMTKRDLKELVTGDDSILGIHISGTDCLAIAASAAEARKKSNRNKLLIIGTIALAVVGAGTAAAIFMKNDKDDPKTDDVCDDIDTDDVNVDIDDIDVPVVDLDDPIPPADLDDTTPSVDLD